METKVKEEVIDETLEEKESINNHEEDQDDEIDFFDNADASREGFEDDDTEEEKDDLEEGVPGQDTVKFTDTNEEDEQYFKLAIGLLDSTRAMAFSMYRSGNADHVDDYIYYKDWKDPKHKEFLEAGRVVAKKYKIASFQYLPEFALIAALIISSWALFSQAKKDKKEDSFKKRQEEEKPPAKEIRMRPITNMKAK